MLNRLFVYVFFAGAIGIMLGGALRALATSRGWVKVKRGKNHLQTVIIIVAVVFWFSSGFVAVPLVADLLITHEQDPEEAFTMAAGLVALLNVLLCACFGWVIGPDKTPRVSILNPYSEDASNPFDAPEPTDRSGKFSFRDDPDPPNTSP